MTYRTLINRLQSMPPERLNDCVTLFDSDTKEFYSVNGFEVATEQNTDVLDPGHIFLQFSK